jgi:hypothetical protein
VDFLTKLNEKLNSENKSTTLRNGTLHEGPNGVVIHMGLLVQNGPAGMAGVAFVLLNCFPAVSTLLRSVTL